MHEIVSVSFCLFANSYGFVVELGCISESCVSTLRRRLDAVPASSHTAKPSEGFHTQIIIDDAGYRMHRSRMGRPKQFNERLQVTLIEGTTRRIDVLLEDGEYRLDFIRQAIEAEIEKRTSPTHKPPV